jgi:hypothetical protein
MRKVIPLVVVAAVVAAIWAARAPAVRSQATCDASIDTAAEVTGDLLLAVTGPPERAVAAGIHYVGGDGRALALDRTPSGANRIHIPTDRNKKLVQFQDAATDGGSTWLVGAYRNDEPVAGVWRDRRWRWIEPVDPGPLEDEFLGVTVTPDGTAWAVGKHQMGNADYAPLIERSDGRSWSVVASPKIGGSAVLKDVAFAPDGTVWAAGWVVGRDGKTTPLIERWDGSSWSVERVPGEGQLSGIATQPDGSPLAVGWRAGSGGDHIVTVGRRGGSWVRLPGDGDPGRLTAIVIGQATVAAGLRFDDAGLPAPLLVAYADGWRPIDVGAAASAPAGGQLLAVTGEAGGFLAVGLQGADTGFTSLVVAGRCGG